MVLESWESIQGNQNVPLFVRGTYRGARECLRVMGLEQAESRRVALSFGFCLES